MSIININQVCHDFGNKLLFENINLAFDNNTKAGLIGRNGTGKTTLFKIITREIAPQQGSVHIAKGYKIGYFAQGVDFQCEEPLWGWLYKSRAELIAKQAELHKTEQTLQNTHDERLTERLHTLQVEYELLGGYTYQNEIETMLVMFGFKKQDYTTIINDLSGGEKTRARLINLLLNRFDFILFDEPTNHLDLLSVDWFIGYLKSLNCGYLIVSHDRYLLDQTVKKIYELKDRRIDTYSGNYTAYTQQAKEREMVLERQYKQQQKLISKTEDFIRRNMAGQKVQQAKSRLKMLNRMQRIQLDPKENTIKLNISANRRSGNDIYRLKGLQIGYPSKVLASGIDLHLHYKDKVCLIGANGSGKTTLLRILLGELEPLAGELWTGYSLSVGYYDQQHIDLSDELTVLETIWSLAPGETFGYVMTYLAKFGFYEDTIEQKVASLSGGERARLYLAQLIHENPNLLILDEPTNHLDISMILSLEKALKDYNGTIVLVSHDRFFIQNITNHFWVIKDNTIQARKDTFENIIDTMNPYIVTKTKPASQRTVPTPKAKKPNAYMLNKLNGEIEQVCQQISEKQAQLVETQSLFANSEFYRSAENISKANKDIEGIKGEIVALHQRKDELETEYLLLLES